MTGSCLCAAVTYTVAGLDGPIGHCHCQTCRKAHSAAFATVARVRADEFRWTGGQDKLRQFTSSPGKHRVFCGECGTHIVALLDGADQMVLRVASLDDDPGEQPIAHIWTSHDRPWLGWKHLPEHQEWSPPPTPRGGRP